MMNIIKRYRKLTFWNKLGTLGAFASIAGIFLAIFFFAHSRFFGSTKKILELEESNIKLTKDLIKLVEKGQDYYNIHWKELEEKYPEGYVLFIVDKERHIWKPWKSQFSEKFEVHLDTAEVSTLSKEFIAFKFPTIFLRLPNGEKERLSHGNILGGPRKIGILRGVSQLLQDETSNYKLETEILVDDIEGLICLLGLKVIKQFKVIEHGAPFLESLDDNGYDALLERAKNEKNEILRAIALSDLGLYYSTHNNLFEAEYAHIKSLRLFEKSKFLRGMAVEYANLGLVYTKRGDLDEGEYFLQESLKISEPHSMIDLTANQYFNLGSVYKAKGDVEKARKYWVDARDLYEKIGNMNRAKEIEDALKKLIGNSLRR